ncbi:extracellular metalloprotease [Xylaria sp. FL0064]|nr:extracellular metalloprotease [Xylaria sp. FL0064]
MSSNFINNPAVLLGSKAENDSGGKRAQAQMTGTLSSSTTPVYYWYFDETTPTEPNYSEKMVSVHKSSESEVESIINIFDERVPVDLKEYQNADGKFRAVVKLWLLYENSMNSGLTEDEAPWFIATGWLVARDIVVTAGHCAYSHEGYLGRLVKAKVYMGYTGRASIGKLEVKFRSGIAAALPVAWLDTDGGDAPRDVSFIKLSEPFTEQDVKSCFSWEQTPISQQGADLGIVGYPGDIVNDKGESGAKMYQMFNKTDYNLKDARDQMLKYQIDTAGGNSGSPVFSDQTSLKGIGVHVLGGPSYNFASVIAGSSGGEIGNNFEAYLSVVRQLNDNRDHPEDSVEDSGRAGLYKCGAVTTESDADDPLKVGLEQTRIAAQAVHAAIPDTILDSDEQISYGPKAGPQIAILASAAIAAAGKLAADSASETQAKELGETRAYDGLLGRAILAESALQCYLELVPRQQETFAEFLGPLVAAIKPAVIKVAPRVLKGILEPGLRLLLSNMVPTLDTQNKRESRPYYAEINTGIGRPLTENESTFLDGLIEVADDTVVESFLTTLTTVGDVLGSAFKKAGPVLADVATKGLPLLMNALASESSAPETNLDPLAHRAILAEACLQAYIAMPDTDSRKNGVYKKIDAKVMDLGPKLMRASPFVAKLVGPIVADILREVNAEKRQKEFLDFDFRF